MARLYRLSDIDLPPTRHEITFTADGNRTEMTGSIIYASQEARDAAYASVMGEGMGASFDRLEEAAQPSGSVSPIRTEDLPLPQKNSGPPPLSGGSFS